LSGFQSSAVSSLVSNLQTECTTVKVGGHDLPLTRNDGGEATNYLCCPSAAYIDYAIDELRHFSARPWLKGLLQGLIECARPLMTASRLDRQVQPNNGLVATNLFPDLSQADIAQATRAFTALYPTHSLVWRSVNDQSTAQLKARFEAAGYHAFPSRQIYLFDARAGAPKVSRDEARDIKLLARGGYNWTQGPWRPEDFVRMAGLYRQLYLDKYTWLNPVYTPLFIEQGHASGELDLHVLRNEDGRIDGVVGFIDHGDSMAAPVVGYDTELPAERGLYRRLMAIAMTRARERRLLYNMSAGAAGFKRNRGGTPALEYLMVYNRHLGLGPRLAAYLVRSILNTIGVPILKRFEL
jgi:hypothetical protein